MISIAQIEVIPFIIGAALFIFGIGAAWYTFPAVRQFLQFRAPITDVNQINSDNTTHISGQVVTDETYPVPFIDTDVEAAMLIGYAQQPRGNNRSGWKTISNIQILGDQIAVRDETGRAIINLPDTISRFDYRSANGNELRFKQASFHNQQISSPQDVSFPPIAETIYDESARSAGNSTVFTVRWIETGETTHITGAPTQTTRATPVFGPENFTLYPESPSFWQQLVFFISACLAALLGAAFLFIQVT